MKKSASIFVLLLVFLRKINVAKAEPKTIVVPARAHKSSDGYLFPKRLRQPKQGVTVVRGEDGE